MKTAELRGLGEAELVGKLAELREDVFRLRFKKSTGELEDTSKIRTAKKDIARILTLLTEKRTGRA